MIAAPAHRSPRQFTAFVAVAASLAGCGSVHTLESTAEMNHRQLLELCADLELRANMDCRWNVEERPSSFDDRQTWEISCMTRRESARESYDNVCHPARLGAPPNEPQE